MKSIRLSSFFFIAALVISAISHAGDADIVKELTAKGATFKSTGSVVTSCQIVDCAKWSDDDFKKLAQLTGLHDLDFAKNLTDQQLALIGGLTEVAVIQTNLAQVTDVGVKQFAQFKKLRTLKFFHPNKSFTGTGLAELADLASLQSLTVAGSPVFADEGMAAVAKLQQLRELRTWHAGLTPDGVAKVKDLKNLKSINLGQHLAYKPPSSISDQTIAVLLEMKSLESIQLSEARLKLAALSQLKELPKLKTLTLDGIDLPEIDVETLKKELPNVQVKWTKPTDSYMKRINSIFGQG